MVRLIALLLTVLTGFAALVYEVAWQKYLAALLGSHGEATAAVLAIFLGGLSCGYALFGWATRRVLERARQSGRRPRLLSFYARVEAGMGVYALLFPIHLWLRPETFAARPAPPRHARIRVRRRAFGSTDRASSDPDGGTIPVLTLALAGGF
jgi:MFS family permease